ncbi:MAG: hypothetical protein FD145_1002 [Candidatus Saganbacteria bacterium]|uniref:YqgF/RNase H-like domain-containing protein n=1 Tax=Candidatus Saganbacteria bacterium TaxID=2575572 RepID=A0A833NZT1_UNCSA|nr:MAG: hypothetical protein FD145_1002 [Candidatus Saganbacteria bacterium]
MIIAVDPGTKKCGVAILDNSSNVLEKAIVETLFIGREIEGYLDKYHIKTIVIGKGTSSKACEKEIQRIKNKCSIVFANEKNTSLEARKRYWADHPRSWLLKFIPTSLLAPKEPIDDYAAVILGERYLKG